MSDDSLNHSSLLSLEARLAAVAPRLSAPEQQQLLYQCAFAAGRKAGIKTLRSWQFATVGLAVLVLGISVPRSEERQIIVEHEPWPSSFPKRSDLTLEELRVPTVLPAREDVPLDAWQIPPSEENSVSQTLAQYDQADPKLRSLTVGALTRQLTE